MYRWETDPLPRDKPSYPAAWCSANYLILGHALPYRGKRNGTSGDACKHLHVLADATNAQLFQGQAQGATNFIQYVTFMAAAVKTILWACGKVTRWSAKPTRNVKRVSHTTNPDWVTSLEHEAGHEWPWEKGDCRCMMSMPITARAHTGNGHLMHQMPKTTQLRDGLQTIWSSSCLPRHNEWYAEQCNPRS